MTWTSVPKIILFLALLLANGMTHGCSRTVASPLPEPSEPMVILPPWDEGVPGLAVPVPANYSRRSEKGPDFDIHVLQTEARSAASALIYIGHSPDLLHRQVDESVAVLKRSETIGGESVTVYDLMIEGNEGCRFAREAVLANVFGDPGNNKQLEELRVHILVTAPSRDEVNRLWAYVSRIRRQRDRISR